MKYDDGEFKPLPEPKDKWNSGTAREWYNSVIGEEFRCPNCESSYQLDKSNVSLMAVEEPSRLMKKLSNYIDSINAYLNSKEHIENGLFTNDGILINGLIKCSQCNSLFSHDDYRIKYDIPSSEHQS